MNRNQYFTAQNFKKHTPETQSLPVVCALFDL